MIFEMGANLDGDNFDTSKNDKKSKKTINEIIPKNQHQLVFTFEKRKGKPVTLVGRFYIEEKEKKEVLKLLKKRLACGGSIKEEWIEIQGDVKDKIKTILEEKDWKFKK
ncbi:translation initiation factor SUI1 [Halarcobacter sp.]|uniref:translation initiation factor SUI1 n=1 Tax=Halarcobacter sp. TaxID=2321133 RepID=UPI0029F5120E|nr:translation initiation factor SUI1 [Halarcobacter sp.]